MTLLLDTHAWIWWVDQDRRLGAAAIAALDRLPPDQRRSFRTSADGQRQMDKFYGDACLLEQPYIRTTSRA